MQLTTFSTYLQKIEKTSLRLEITQYLAELLTLSTPQEAQMMSYLLQGRVAPMYNAQEFGISEKLIIKACVESLGIDEPSFKKLVQEKGDIGEALSYCKLQDTTTALTVMDVFDVFTQITNTVGEGSVDKKITLLSDLVKKSDTLSSKYLVRIPAGTLRLGASDATIMDALSWSLVGDKSLRPIIEKAYQVRPDLGYLLFEVKNTNSVERLSMVRPELFTPILMMRAERASTPEEVLEHAPEVIIEEKYDGFRLQVHYEGKTGNVKLYSRGLEDMSHMFPDIVKELPFLKNHSIIFEGEAVGINPLTGEHLPFQETVQRKRKHGIDEAMKNIPVKIFVFDLLKYDTEDVLYLPLTKRRFLLEQIFDRDSIFVLPKSTKTTDPKVISTLFEEAVKANQEGLMAKKPDGLYTPGNRNWGWMKYKTSYDESRVNDTIDCVVMGYDYGKGKRTSFGIGAFLVGVKDGDSIKTVAKIGTGLTDTEWKTLKERCSHIIAHQLPKEYDIDAAVACDIYVYPHIIVEIRADEITRSEMHTAGRRVEESLLGAVTVLEQGYALRFPRLEKFRTDKKVDDITTVNELKTIAKNKN